MFPAPRKKAFSAAAVPDSVAISTPPPTAVATRTPSALPAPSSSWSTKSPAAEGARSTTVSGRVSAWMKTSPCERSSVVPLAESCSRSGRLTTGAAEGLPICAGARTTATCPAAARPGAPTGSTRTSTEVSTVVARRSWPWPIQASNASAVPCSTTCASPAETTVTPAAPAPALRVPWDADTVKRSSPGPAYVSRSAPKTSGLAAPATTLVDCGRLNTGAAARAISGSVATDWVIVVPTCVRTCRRSVSAVLSERW